MEEDATENQDGASQSAMLEGTIPEVRGRQFGVRGGTDGRGRVADRQSAYRGVYWDSRDKVWFVKFKIGNDVTALGRFACEEKAARRYDRYLKLLEGRIKYNFPEDQEAAVLDQNPTGPPPRKKSNTPTIEFLNENDDA